MVYEFPTKRRWTGSNLNSSAGIDEISDEELEQSLKLMKERKAAGPDGLNSELFKYGGPVLSNRLIELINKRWIQK